MAVVTVKAGIDTWSREPIPAGNYGSGVALGLRGAGTGNRRWAYLHFKRPFPLGATIISATLKVYLRGAWSGTNTVTAMRVTETWAENTLNWNNQPDATTTDEVEEVVTDGATADELAFDVTNLMQAVSGEAAYAGFRLVLDEDVERNLHSSEAVDPAVRPVLEIEWSEAPEAPTSLAPAGGRAISDTKPLLTWKFADKLGNVEQASSQVQISTDPDDFTVPEYDSTKVANTESEWDLAATAYAGLADTDVRYWRVMVWDGADLESEWSDVEEFTRLTQAVLTITNPPSGGTVEETTPPISWTFVGRTQEAYRIELLRVNANGSTTRLHLWDKTVSTDTSVTVPAGKIKTGEDYRVVVRVWDDQDRQSMAGDPDYVQATHDFDYAREGTPAAVETLTAVGDDASVILTWTRTLEPDYFALSVDGVLVEDRIDPQDVFVAGTTYSMSYWGALPRVEHTYEIEAVVLDTGVLTHSDGNATDTATTRPIGIWLVDPEDDTAVFIASREDAEFSIGESGATFHLIGRRSPVRITDTLRGYEGNISGVLLDKDSRDDFLELKSRLTDLRLIVGDLNLPGMLEEVSVTPSPIPGDEVFPVSFAFFQTSDWTFGD